MRKNPNIYLTF